jgi:hypothetical protein
MREQWVLHKAKRPRHRQGKSTSHTFRPRSLHRFVQCGRSGVILALLEVESCPRLRRRGGIAVSPCRPADRKGAPRAERHLWSSKDRSLPPLADPGRRWSGPDASPPSNSSAASYRTAVPDRLGPHPQRGSRDRTNRPVNPQVRIERGDPEQTQTCSLDGKFRYHGLDAAKGDSVQRRLESPRAIAMQGQSVCLARRIGLHVYQSSNASAMAKRSPEQAQCDAVEVGFCPKSIAYFDRPTCNEIRTFAVG